MKVDKIKASSDKIYNEIEKNNIKAIIALFSRGKSWPENLIVDQNREYIKRMIISQLDVDRLLLIHKYYNLGFEEKQNFSKESENILKKVKSDEMLIFDEETIKSLFNNTLNILNEEQLDEWKDFLNTGWHNGMEFNKICEEERIKMDFESENNPIKKIVKIFKYKKVVKENFLEDSFLKKVREMVKRELKEEPENYLYAYSKCRYEIEKGIGEFESLNGVESIVKMVLTSLKGQPNEIIDIEETCKKNRKEMKNDIKIGKMEKEYRTRSVTLGAKTGIQKRDVIQATPFEQIPNEIKKLQKRYEEIYTAEIGPEEYIKQASKIYVDFIYIQPYEDGNKRTALCLFNNMLLSKGIVPPPISLANDEKMAEAFYKVKDENDYTMLQDIIIKEYRKTQNEDVNNDSNDKSKEFEGR